MQNASLFSDAHAEVPLTADLSAVYRSGKVSATAVSGRGRENPPQPPHPLLDESKRIDVEKLSGAEYDALTTPGQQESFSILDKLPSLATQVEAEAKDKPGSEEKVELRKHAVDKDSADAGSRQSCGPILEQAEPQPKDEDQHLDDRKLAERRAGGPSERLRRRTSLQPLQAAPPASLGGAESVLLKQFASPKGGGSSPMHGRSREASGTPPTPGNAAGVPFGRARPPSEQNVSGVRDRAHTVSGPSPRRMAAMKGGASNRPVTAGVVQRGPDFLGGPTALKPAPHPPASPGLVHAPVSSKKR